MKTIVVSKWGLGMIRLLVILNWGSQQVRFDFDRLTSDPAKR
jgi:hypothetical protein